MATTTIRVDRAVRDRLARVAHARGMTMAALVAQLAERLEDEQRWREIEAAYERLRRDDPAGWAEYLDELAEWEGGPAGVDTTAVTE